MRLAQAHSNCPPPYQAGDCSTMVHESMGVPCFPVCRTEDMEYQDPAPCCHSYSCPFSPAPVYFSFLESSFPPVILTPLFLCQPPTPLFFQPPEAAPCFTEYFPPSYVPLSDFVTPPFTPAPPSLVHLSPPHAPSLYYTNPYTFHPCPPYFIPQSDFSAPPFTPPPHCLDQLPPPESSYLVQTPPHTFESFTPSDLSLPALTPLPPPLILMSPHESPLSPQTPPNVPESTRPSYYYFPETSPPPLPPQTPPNTFRSCSPSYISLSNLSSPRLTPSSPFLDQFSPSHSPLPPQTPPQSPSLHETPPSSPESCPPQMSPGSSDSSVSFSESDSESDVSPHFLTPLPPPLSPLPPEDPPCYSGSFVSTHTPSRRISLSHICPPNFSLPSLTQPPSKGAPSKDVCGPPVLPAPAFNPGVQNSSDIQTSKPGWVENLRVLMLKRDQQRAGSGKRPAGEAEGAPPRKRLSLSQPPLPPQTPPNTFRSVIPSYISLSNLSSPRLTPSSPFLDQFSPSHSPLPPQTPPQSPSLHETPPSSPESCPPQMSPGTSDLGSDSDSDLDYPNPPHCSYQFSSPQSSLPPQALTQFLPSLL